MTQHPVVERDVHALFQGLVVRKSQGAYAVEVGDRLVPCGISNQLRKQLIYPLADPGSRHHRVDRVAQIGVIDPIAIGDIIRFVDAGDGTGVIHEVMPRKNKLVRRAAGLKLLEQVIVANVDQVLPVVAAALPEPKWELLDRYLAATESRDLPALILVTKLDLVSRDILSEAVDEYERIGYRVILTSARSGEGIEELREALRDRVSVVVGKSGVGKSSILNALEPGLGLRVNEVGELTGKGKHTTSHLELFKLAVGGAIVDTPGMREFGLWEVDDDELAENFLEFRTYRGRCRFGVDCLHTHEPGCAVKAAVTTGAIGERRYASYVRMLAGGF
ncbi:MAG TPA: ribosome small subunit-dependent GTPase A [Chloroflexota bacterium]|nr:ribosome small subunit-dependent GTPase A [Chloroflexota bacterium]